jgi:hypothetical protein
MRAVIGSLEGEYRRYRHLGERAIRQLNDEEVSHTSGPGDNSVAIIVSHVAGNLQSRFTDFLTTDGEKPWRRREAEFTPQDPTQAEVLAKWNAGWETLFGALATLSDAGLGHTVHIRGQAHTVMEALHRSLAHTSYHVGQIVYLAKALRGGTWQYLSIPPGQSEAYNKQPTREWPPGS